jgi:hypothetical protein
MHLKDQSKSLLMVRLEAYEQGSANNFGRHHECAVPQFEVYSTHGSCPGELISSGHQIMLHIIPEQPGISL